MNNIFKLRVETPYKFSRSMIKNVYHETESISYLDQKYGIYCQKN